MNHVTINSRFLLLSCPRPLIGLFAACHVFQADDSAVRLFAELSGDYFGRITSPVVVLHPLHGSPDPFSLQRVLSDVQPRYVVMYDVNVQFVRMLEVVS